MEEMTEKELITVLIDKYTDLQRIKKARILRIAEEDVNN